MRKRFCALALLLSTALPVQAADSYHMELLVFRQGDMQAYLASQLAPDNWSDQSQHLQPYQLRSSLLESTVAKLVPENGYQILLHRVWQQNADSNSTALSGGDEIFGHHPVEGTLHYNPRQGQKAQLDFWINQFKTDGNLAHSERLKRDARIPLNELTYIDYGDLGVLVRVQPQ